MTPRHHRLRDRAEDWTGPALDAVWACHACLTQAATVPGDDGARLADLLPDYLEAVHDTDLPGVIALLERILAVLTLDLPGTDLLVTRLLLQQEVTADGRTVLADVQAAWRDAGVDC